MPNHLWLHAKTNKSEPEPKQQQLEKQVQVLPKNKEQTSYYQKYFMYHRQQTTYRQIEIFYNLMESWMQIQIYTIQCKHPVIKRQHNPSQFVTQLLLLKAVPQMENVPCQSSMDTINMFHCHERQSWPWVMFDNPTYLDLNLVKGLPIVHTNHTSNHLWDNDHVAEMSPHWLWLLTWRSLPLLEFWKIESTIKTPIYSNRV